MKLDRLFNDFQDISVDNHESVMNQFDPDARKEFSNVEDYVNTYFKRLYPSGRQTMRVGVLLGSVEQYD